MKTKRAKTGQNRKSPKRATFELPYDNPHKNINFEQFQAIFLLLDGATIKDTARQIAVSESTVKRWLYSDEPVGINFRSAYEKEAGQRIEAMRINADTIASDLYSVFNDWISKLKKKKGKLNPKEVQQVLSYLTNSKYLFKNKIEAEAESSRKKILSGLESLLEEKLIEHISSNE
ncbi:helix-turn-helix domain-containing protein [Leptospira interrogans]|uniref:Homeodomain-like domain protein n=1 Tax=Leptospira interrogans str. UI 12758 TaxID=1049938 RepID=A0A0E2DND0_LEPIR|nr:helix-turn-helix domain-containing protein [Leptospira interrogans]EKR57157.1 homeodomain-like domain protein [Leptospira interrogans str. UI 12758]